MKLTKFLHQSQRANCLRHFAFNNFIKLNSNIFNNEKHIMLQLHARLMKIYIFYR